MRTDRRVAVLAAALAGLALAVGLLWWTGREADPPVDPPPETPADLPGLEAPFPDGPPVAVERSGPFSDRVHAGRPAAGEAVLSPLVLAGEAPGGWYFEADFPLRLLDGEGRVVADSFATAEGEWMTEGQVPFTAVLRWEAGEAGPGTLVLERDNASGLPEHDAEVRIPVHLGDGGTPRVYFSNRVLDPDAMDCERVFPVARFLEPSEGELAARVGALVAALTEGPRPPEEAAGYFTSLPGGAGVREVTRRQGTLRVDFDRGLSESVAGSCRVQAIRAQIDSTLARLPGVERVEIAVEGRVEDVLQP